MHRRAAPLIEGLAKRGFRMTSDRAAQTAHGLEHGGLVEALARTGFVDPMLGHSYLAQALMAHQPQRAQAWLEGGATLDDPTHPQGSLLQRIAWMATDSLREALDWALAHGMDPNPTRDVTFERPAPPSQVQRRFTPNPHQPPLSITARRFAVGITQTLLQHGADPLALNDRGTNALYEAADELQARMTVASANLQAFTGLPGAIAAFELLLAAGLTWDDTGQGRAPREAIDTARWLNREAAQTMNVAFARWEREAMERTTPAQERGRQGSFRL